MMCLLLFVDTFGMSTCFFGWTLKMMASNRDRLLQGFIFRCHVSFRGCNLFGERTCPHCSLWPPYLGMHPFVPTPSPNIHVSKPTLAASLHLAICLGTIWISRKNSDPFHKKTLWLCVKNGFRSAWQQSVASQELTVSAWGAAGV